MAVRTVGIIINGATGRMGGIHLKGLLEMRAEGGLPLKNGDRLMPDPLLVGRNAETVKAVAEANGGLRCTTDVGAAIAGPDDIFMDCAATGGRAELVKRAIAAGKHIHVEKPTAGSVEEALELGRLALRAKRKHGVIQDKLYLPGFAKLMFLKQQGFFGRILSARIEAGAWIFDGLLQTCQRPSWNYRKKDGGGLALDMMAHWRYMLDRLCAPVERVTCQLGTATPRRVDEQGEAYDVDVEDTVHALLRLEGGVMATVTNSWAMRIRREDTMVVQIDGTLGSAVAGRHRCLTQAASVTPEGFLAAARPGGFPFEQYWTPVPDEGPHKNPYRQCWEAFLRHWGEDAPYVPTLLEGAKAVQLAELAYKSHAEGRWLDVPKLAL